MVLRLQPLHSNNIAPINNFNDGYTDNLFMYVLYVYVHGYNKQKPWQSINTFNERLSNFIIAT